MDGGDGGAARSTFLLSEINSCMQLVSYGLILELTEKKDGDAVRVFDPGGQLPCAHETDEWGHARKPKEMGSD